MQRDSNTDTRPLEPLVPQTSSYRVMFDTARKRGYQHRSGPSITRGLLPGERESDARPWPQRGQIKYAATPGEYGKAVVLELSVPHPFHAEPQDFKCSQDLSAYLKAHDYSPGCRGVILLEGVARNYFKVLGSHFNIDPSVFPARSDQIPGS